MTELDLSALLSRPLRLSVSLEDSERLREAETGLSSLRAEYARLEHRYNCVCAVLSQIRAYCADAGVQLPDRLAVTPWE